MVNSCFKKLGGDQELVKGKVYEIPQNATHVGVWNGRVNFFRSDSKNGYRGQKWRFFFLGPMKQDYQYGISFPAYCYSDGGGLGKFHGHNYGRSAIISLNGNGNLGQKNKYSQTEKEGEEPIAEPS